MKNFCKILASLAVLIMPASAMADAILLNNGKVIDGIVLKQNEEHIVVQTGRTKLTIPLDTIKERIEESSLAYHLRIGEEAIVADDFQKAESELQLVLAEDPDNDRAQAAMAEAKALLAIVAEEGAAGIARLKEKRRLLDQGDAELLKDNIDGALSNYLQYFELQQDDWRILVEIAEIYRQKALSKFYLPLSEEESYVQFSQQPIAAMQMEFIDTTDVESLQVLKTAKELYAPLAHLRKAPFSVSVFREIHKVNLDLYNMIYYLERLSRLPAAQQELLLPDASLQQWFNVVQLIQEQQKAYYSSLRQLSEREGNLIEESFLAMQADLKQKEINWMWTMVQKMVESGQWGYDLASALTYVKRLNPTPEMLAKIEAFERLNNAKITELQRFNEKVNREQGGMGIVRRPRSFRGIGVSSYNSMSRNWGLMGGNVFRPRRGF